jgi:WD40 repeat protein
VAYSRWAIRLVDPLTGIPLATLQSPDSTQIDCLRFSPDGKRLAVGGDNAIRIWDLETIRRQLAPLGLDWNRVPLTRAPNCLPAHPWWASTCCCNSGFLCHKCPAGDSWNDLQSSLTALSWVR